MSLSPEQMRKKAAAMEESQRHARYAQADGSMREPMRNPPNSDAIAAAGRRVNAATAKEEATIGGENASINDNRY
jgi:hypothetical protein